MTTEVYSILAHGQITSAEVLDHNQRNKIPIISIGIEGELTYPTPTYLLIQYFIQKYGSPFMKKLLYILLEHGHKYISDFVPNNTPIERDVRFLFDINWKDIQKFPSTVLRAYYGQTTIVNIDLTSRPQETMFYTDLLRNDKFNGADPIFLAGQFGSSSYELKTVIDQQSNRVFFNLRSPFGLLKFQETQKNFHLLENVNEGLIPLKDVLDYIHASSVVRDKILLLICCKVMHSTMMDFNIKKFPLEKVQTKSLIQMMSALRLTPTTTRKKKRKERSPTTKSKSSKRTKLI